MLPAPEENNRVPHRRDTCHHGCVVVWIVTANAKMMNDIMEEPEKDTLLEAQEPQVLSVMSAKASPAKASLLIETGRLALYNLWSLTVV